MTGGGSRDYWDEMAVVDEAMTAEGEISDRRVGASSQVATPAHALWTGHRGNRDVATGRAIRRDYVRRDVNRENPCRSDQGHGNVPAMGLDSTVLERHGDGGSFGRVGKNEQSLTESTQPHVLRGSNSLWSCAVLDRNGDPSALRRLGKNEQSLPEPSSVVRVSNGSVSRRQKQRASSPPRSPSQCSQSTRNGWKVFKADQSGSVGDAPRREPPFHLDLNEPAPNADAGQAGSLPVPDQTTTGDGILVAQDHLPHQHESSMGPPALPRTEGLRLLYGMTTACILGSNIAPNGLLEGMELRPNPGSSLIETRDFLRMGEIAEMEGWTIVERPNHQQRAYRSMHRAPDKFNSKRAKYYASTALRINTFAPSQGSSPSSSSSRPGSPSGWDKGVQQQPPAAPLHPPPQGDEREPMDSDNAGGEGGDDGDKSAVVAMEDDEVRMDLTDDLLHKVFSFLDDTALCQAAMVCKQWRVASAHEDFWKMLNFEGRLVTHEQVGLLCVRYPKATNLNLRGAPCVDEVLVREAMRSLRNLEVLTLGRGTLSDAFFYALAVECSSLQNLSISDAVLGSGGAQEIQLRHESLRRLQIFKCRVLRIAIRCPQLDWLSLKRTGTASAMLHCPRLVTLDVSSCHKLSDAGLRAAATACPLLASLDMSNCAYVSDETLREISIACTNLRTLDASYCPNISLEGVRMPMLIELKLQGCDGIISSSMAALSTCAMLEDLAMDFCWLLTAVTLDLPRLRQISLTNNRKFVDLTLRSPALTKLNLVNCPILNRVDITSSSLQSLVLRQQNGLSSMALQCISLREVDLTECEGLTDAVCDVFSDGGGCPKLKSLILDSCEGLNTVKLASSSLQSLSLGGCRNIKSLNLACPVLQQLHLDGCEHLMTASFAPVGLQTLNLGICPHLVKLEVEASQMTTLDLRGCGVLSDADIRCPSLMSLDASYCSQLGDDCLAATTSQCPAIQSLVLASCPSVGPAGLLALRRLKDLTMLDLSYTFLTDLSPIFEACPGLEVLRLSACKYLGDTALDALHRGKVLPGLRELDLSYGSLGNSAIEGVVALCPHLAHVSLNGCAHVTDLLWARLSSPPLTSIASDEGSGIKDTGMEEASYSHESSDFAGNEGEQPMDVAMSRDDGCSSELSTLSEGVNDVQVVGGRAINSVVAVLVDLPVSDSVRLDVESETITGIHVALLESEASMDLEVGPVRALQSLSCVGCPHIKKVVIPRFAACLHLSSLNLSLSMNIREVQLSCTNLTSLNLSNCAGLVVLELECPRLVSLFLQACGIETEMLELAIQGCGLLETLDVRSCSKVSSATLARMRSVCPGLKRLYSTMST